MKAHYNSSTRRLQCPASHLGLVIGQRGSTISLIEKTTFTKIVIDRKTNPHPTISIESQRPQKVEDVERAVQRIRLEVENVDDGQGLITEILSASHPPPSTPKPASAMQVPMQMPLQVPMQQMPMQMSMSMPMQPIPQSAYSSSLNQNHMGHHQQQHHQQHHQQHIPRLIPIANSSFRNDGFDAARKLTAYLNLMKKR